MNASAIILNAHDDLRSLWEMVTRNWPEGDTMLVLMDLISLDGTAGNTAILDPNVFFILGLEPPTEIASKFVSATEIDSILGNQEKGQNVRRLLPGR